MSARAAALARTSKYAAGPVDPGDDRETRPSAEGISDEEIEEVRGVCVLGWGFGSLWIGGFFDLRPYLRTC